uniref:Uncharacterized protein MANES_12G092600 n=1 Tax=Rhizophora mucronata TaxID=61149 RepID=A0A2P2KN32_RHIMU
MAGMGKCVSGASKGCRDYSGFEVFGEKH